MDNQLYCNCQTWYIKMLNLICWLMLQILVMKQFGKMLEKEWQKLQRKSDKKAGPFSHISRAKLKRPPQRTIGR